MAAELRAPESIQVHKSAQLLGKLEEHRFDAIAQNGAPVLALHGISFDSSAKSEIRSAVDALAFAMLDVRTENPTIALGVLAVHNASARSKEEHQEILERASKVFEGVGATIVTEDDARDWAFERISAYDDHKLILSRPPQLALPDAA